MTLPGPSRTLHILVAGSKNVEFFGTVPPDDGEIPF